VAPVGGREEQRAADVREIGGVRADLSTAKNANVTVVLSGGIVKVFGTHTYVSPGGQTATVDLWVPGNVSAEATATIDVGTHVTGQVKIKRTTPTQNPTTGLYTGTITVTNPSTGSTISGSLAAPKPKPPVR
jgi:hypothetical protein